MKIGDVVKHRGYPITKKRKDDYVVGVGHDTLKDAKEWIDQLIRNDELEGEEEKK